MKDKVLELLAENTSQAEIARQLGISRQRVNQIQSPLKHAARRKLNQSKTERPSNCSCCNQAVKVQGHHHDYNKPLNVVWLCSRCHADYHEQRECTANSIRKPNNRAVCPECSYNKAAYYHINKCPKTYIYKE